jgi:WD40 repeat protein/predicted Ser/Thr protein kinase
MAPAPSDPPDQTLVNAKGPTAHMGEPTTFTTDQIAIQGYEILGELGRGGMGVVYKAQQVGLNRIVALKMVLSGAHAEADELARFRTEAEAVARLQHPNIVQVYEVGEQRGLPYFSLEFVDGGSLEDRIDGKPMAPIAAAQLLEKVARGVQAAHARNIIHRDLKPANILITRDGEPKVADFGLAKRLDAEGATQTGSIMGTPSYMAPEQAAGFTRDVGPAADVYSLGAILYECLTGDPPFSGPSDWGTINLVITADPTPPRQRLPHLPKDINTICLKCLEKEPNKRYCSASALADDLHHFLNSEPILARPVGPIERSVKWARRRPAHAALLGVVIIAAVVLLGVATMFHLKVRQSLVETQDQMTRLKVATGSQMVDDGDVLGALPWFLGALESDPYPERTDMHRIRLATVLRQCPRLEHIWFHEGRVTRVAFNHDGSRALSASADHTASIWNTETGALVAGPLKHDDVINDAAFRPDGAAVATASADGTARVWDAVTGQPLTEPMRHPGPVSSVVFDAEGGRIVTVGSDDQARIWPYRDHGECVSLRHRGRVRSAVFSPDGKQVLTASDDNTAQIWNAVLGVGEGAALTHPREVIQALYSPDGKWVLTICGDGEARLWPVGVAKPTPTDLRNGHAGKIVCAAFNADGSQIATGSEDNSARVWDTATARPVVPAMAHGSTVMSVAFSPDGQKLATASDDKTARVWVLDSVRPTLACVPLNHNGTVTQATIHPKLAMLLTASTDGTARLWARTADRFRGRVLPHERFVNRAVFSPDGQRVLTASNDHTAVIRDAASGQQVHVSAMRHDGPVLSAEFSSDGLWVVTAGADGKARVWDAQTGNPVTPWLEHRGPVRDAHFSHDGQWVVTASEDGTAAVWEARTGARRSGFSHARSVLSARFSPDGKHVISTSVDRTAEVWDAATGQRTLPHALAHPEEVWDGAFSPDGKRLVTACDDGVARLWDAVRGEPVGQPMRHGSRVSEAKFSSDSHWVVTASDDNTSRVWDGATGQPRTPPLAHRGSVRHAEFGPTGTRVVTCSEDNTARIWDARTGEPLTPALEHKVAVMWASISPDGTEVVTAGHDRTARIWSIGPDKRPLDELKLLCRLLAGGQMSGSTGYLPLSAKEFRETWQEYCQRYPHTPGVKEE